MRYLFVFCCAILFPINIIFAEDGVEEENPWYFPEGMITTTDPLKQRQESIRYLTATYDCFQMTWDRSHGPIITEPDSLFYEIDIESTSSLTEKNSVKMKLYLDNYVRMPDGRIRVTTFNEQRFITEKQLTMVKQNMIDKVKAASKYNIDFYSPVHEGILKLKAEQMGLSVEDLKKKLDEEAVDCPGTALWELHFVARPFKQSDFVPSKLHLGATPDLQKIYGLCWPNTGLVYYNPQSSILDKLMGYPDVLIHETVHGNHKLQKYPFTFGFNVEVFASISEMLSPNNKIDLSYHSYAQEFREMIHVFGGFNFVQARKEVEKYDRAGNLEVDEKKYREYADKLEEAKKVMLDVLQNKALPLFYADQIYSLAFHEKMQDNIAMLRVALAGELDMTILGGKLNTRKWLEMRREKILDMAKKAYAKSGEQYQIEGSYPRIYSFKEEFYKMAKEEKWTEEETLAAIYYAYRLYFLEQREDKSGYKMIWSRLTYGKIREVLDKYIKITEELTGYKSEAIANYMDWLPGMKEAMEKEERAMKALRARFLAVELHNEFNRLVGNGNYKDSLKDYNPRTIFANKNFSESYFFTVDYVKEARRRGDLKPIESLFYNLDRKLDSQEPEPVYSENPKDRIWKQKIIGLDLTAYKITDENWPENNQFNYIEGYRMTFKDGKEQKESKASFKVFRLRTGGPSVVVIDFDKEGDLGYGLPDEVFEDKNITGVNDVCGANNSYLSRWFKSEKGRSSPFLRKSVFMEFARASDLSDVWDESDLPWGWIAPIKYLNDAKDNYNVKIIFEKEGVVKKDGVKKIKFFKIEYTDGSQNRFGLEEVISYHLPKGDCADEIRSALIEGGKKIKIVMSNGGEIAGCFNLGDADCLLAEKEPVMIDYTEGDRRWRIKKENSDVFNKKKEILRSADIDRVGKYDLPEEFVE